MFAAVLALLLSAGPQMDDAPVGLLPEAGHRIQKRIYVRWLHSYPYSTALYQHSGYDYRHEQDYPWSVRSSYSLPEWAAASGRVPPTAMEDPPGEPAKKMLPTGPRATSSR